GRVQPLRLEHADQLFQIGVLLDRLLHVGILHQLVGEFRTVHRLQRVLMLKLGGQQRQERVEVVRQGGGGGRRFLRGAGRVGDRGKRAKGRHASSPQIERSR